MIKRNAGFWPIKLNSPPRPKPCKAYQDSRKKWDAWAQCGGLGVVLGPATSFLLADSAPPALLLLTLVAAFRTASVWQQVKNPGKNPHTAQSRSRGLFFSHAEGFLVCIPTYATG